jgi:hypothetical protein
MRPNDSVRVTIVVELPPVEAFDAFTSDVDVWWRRGPRYRTAGARPSTMRFEGGAGGRLVEICEGPRGERFEYGRVLAWEPPGHLRFEFRGRNFERGQTTWVDVRFEPDPGGTRVTLENGGFAELPLDHPVRHGADEPQFVASMGRWWLELLQALRSVTRAGRRPPSGSA